MATERDEHRSDSDRSGTRATENEKDLKSREYRDKSGDVHHHTKTYMEQHKGERG